MRSLTKAGATGDRQRRFARAKRYAGPILYCKAAVVLLIVVLASALYLRLFVGPIGLDAYAGTLESSLASRLGAGWTVKLARPALELHGLKPAVSTAALEVRNPANLQVLRAPHALVSLNPWSLLVGSVSPRDVELRDLHVKALISEGGAVVLETQGGRLGERPVLSPTPAQPSTPAAPLDPARLAALLRSAIEPIVQSTGALGGLDRVSVVGAHLTLVGSDGRERAAFDRLNVLFDREADGARRISLGMEGASGSWRVRGRVAEYPELAAELEILSVPLSDVLMMAGGANLPVQTDLRLSGRLATSFSSGLLSRLDASFETTSGLVARPKYQPIRFDRLAGAARWDPDARALRIDRLDVESEGTRVQLKGGLAAEGGGWRLRLSGQDSVIAGLSSAHGPFTLDSLGADILIAEDRIVLDGGHFKGQAVDIGFSGHVAFTAGGPTLKSVIEARDTDARRLVRLWPDSLNPKLREFLATRLGAGQVRSLLLRSDLDTGDFVTLFNEDPMSERSTDLSFTAAAVELAPVEGLPSVRGLDIEGKASGTNAVVTTKAGHIRMPDGRELQLPTGTFSRTAMDRPDSPAQISFRILGGADALLAFTRSPAFGAAATTSLDPASVTGEVDVSVALQLVPGPLPPLGDLALTVQGRLRNIGAEKLPAREILEGGEFLLRYGAGALSIQGEGRLSGTPAQIELSAPASGEAQLAIALTLDDAGRTRRSLPAGPSLIGPVPVRVTAKLGGAAPVAQVEADLSRAAVDGLVPGWTKPTNKPARISFRIMDGEPPKLQDFRVDAAPVQIKGEVALAEGGAIGRAEFGTFKLSPGDDLRVLLERAGENGGYKVTLRGNNADARPFLHWIGSSATKAGPKERPDLELDAAVNILTGHGDEAMTRVSAKGSAKGGELRSLQMSGRFRAAKVEAQLGKRDSGAPVLNIRSGDAGALLRFVDIYRRMTGGTLALDARSGGGVQEGRLTIEDFGVRSEPALRRIVSQAAEQIEESRHGHDRGLAPIARSDVDKVLFNKLVADFRRSSGRVDLSQIMIYGPQVGFNLSGWIDFARDRLDVTGTFVPAYALNTVFNHLPVVGFILGGGEGLIAIDFRLAGGLSGPTLTVNPLTVVAPGILRKLFGWMLESEPPPAASEPRRAR